MLPRRGGRLRTAIPDHSPYTEALLETIGQPGLEIGRIFRTVRAKVREKSEGKQVPIEQAQLPDEDIYLVAATGQAPVWWRHRRPSRRCRPQPQLQEDPLLIYLDAVQRQDRTALEDFLRRYPGSSARQGCAGLGDGDGREIGLGKCQHAEQ